MYTTAYLNDIYVHHGRTNDEKQEEILMATSENI
jgi:hypothetical protein